MTDNGAFTWRDFDTVRSFEGGRVSFTESTHMRLEGTRLSVGPEFRGGDAAAILATRDEISYDSTSTHS